MNTQLIKLQQMGLYISPKQAAPLELQLRMQHEAINRSSRRDFTPQEQGSA